MTDINNIDVKETGTYKDLFSFKLNYNIITRLISNPANFKPLYNGNISETIWKTNDNKIRSYSYRYDGLNRLISANYIKGANEVVNAFNEDIKGYDKNGNINGIIRTGNQDLSSSPIWIDDLTYSYKANSNKLLSVTDSKIIVGFNDGNKTGDDYAYDVNGNLTIDKNKGITKITYNFLNLPTEVLWNASKKINYTYDASGVKLRKIVTDGTTITTTDYLGSFQYQNNVLQFFPTAEGYVNVTNGTAFNYVYNYTDHLGNVRLSYQKNTDGTVKVIDENNYYPFGLKHNRCGNGQLCLAEGSVSLDIVGSNSYKYKYQGQELQDELGLNWYSYKYRNYDPTIGRFFNVDPLSEDYEWQSVYSFSSNQPIHAAELEGLESANDLNKRLAIETVKKDGALSVVRNTTAWGAYTGIASSEVRKNYIKTVSNLDKADSKGRLEAKMDARSKTPALTRAIIESERPSTVERTKTSGTANKTNSSYNNKANVYGKTGKALAVVGVGISINNIATSDDKNQQILTEGASWAGAIAGGEAGGTAGAVAGPYGALVGGILGAVTGGILGEVAVSAPKGGAVSFPDKNKPIMDGGIQAARDNIEKQNIR